MKALAHLELVVVALGLQHLGGALRFYELPDAEAVETLAYALVASYSPELIPGPLTHNGAIAIWNAAHAKPKPAAQEEYFR